VIFADTGALFALCVSSDLDHEAARGFLASSDEIFATSDYVIDEFLTLCKVRREYRRGVEFFRSILDGNTVLIERVTDADFMNAWHIYTSHQDKQWSFTDCTSLALMRRLEIRTAFSFDGHFRQFGDVVVVPM
jgi:predicted nucleic acid-binding protein